jgi:hypothetical protein
MVQSTYYRWTLYSRYLNSASNHCTPAASTGTIFTGCYLDGRWIRRDQVSNAFMLLPSELTLSRPNIATLVVEQIPDINLRVSENKNGQRVIIDPAATRSRVLLYFYTLINVGSIAGMLCTVYAVSWMHHERFWPVLLEKLTLSDK